MSHVTRVFKTVGPLANKTIELAGCQFKDGKYVFTGPEKDADGLGLYLFRSWQVEIVTGEEAQKDAPSAPPLQKENTPNQSQALGNERLSEALRKLDPENDAHWTKLGKPTMSGVEQFYGSADVTRADVEAAIPDFSRDVARAEAAAKAAGAGSENDQK